MEVTKISRSAGAQQLQRAAQAKGIINSDDFYKLLVAQIKHQDPTKPMDSAQAVTQMAQIAGSQASLEVKNAALKISAQNKVGLANSMIGKYAKVKFKKGAAPQVVKIESVRFGNKGMKMVAGGKEIYPVQIVELAADKQALGVKK